MEDYDSLEDAEELSEIAKYQTSARQIEEATQERNRVKGAEQRAIRIEKRAIRAEERAIQAEERETTSDRRAKRADRRERIMMWVIIIETILLAVSIALNIWMQ